MKSRATQDYYCLDWEILRRGIGKRDLETLKLYEENLFTKRDSRFREYGRFLQSYLHIIDKYKYDLSDIVQYIIDTIDKKHLNY